MSYGSGTSNLTIPSPLFNTKQDNEVPRDGLAATFPDVASVGASAVTALLLAAALFHMGYAPARAQNDLPEWRVSLSEIRATAALLTAVDMQLHQGKQPLLPIP